MKVRFRYWEEVVNTYDVTLDVSDEMAGDEDALIDEFHRQKEEDGSFYDSLDLRGGEVVESDVSLIGF